MAYFKKPNLGMIVCKMKDWEIFELGHWLNQAPGPAQILGHFGTFSNKCLKMIKFRQNMLQKFIF